MEAELKQLRAESAIMWKRIQEIEEVLWLRKKVSALNEVVKSLKKYIKDSNGHI